jgi:hypothetical protein
VHVSRIISGGQTGVDRAALDAAIRHGIEYGGWCPRGGWAEDLTEPPGLLARYPRLHQTLSANPAERSRWNVRDSEAVLVLLPPDRGMSRGTDRTVTEAHRIGRPCFVLHGEHGDRDEQVDHVLAWLARYDITGELDVAGPRESEAPGAYHFATDLLDVLLPRVSR